LHRSNDHEHCERVRNNQSGAQEQKRNICRRPLQFFAAPKATLTKRVRVQCVQLRAKKGKPAALAARSAALAANGVVEPADAEPTIVECVERNRETAVASLDFDRLKQV
jgi:hypothetical protein